MKRIFPDYTYGPGPRSGCWWDETISAPDWPVYSGTERFDVAVIGGGFTGLSAALRLAESGARVAVLEAGAPGWGASGRNGGFCCLGGGLHDEATLARRYGQQQAELFGQAQIAAVDLVADFLRDYDVDADVHSRGETVLAHTERAARNLRKQAQATSGTELPGEWVAAADLRSKGLGGSFHGALTWPKGFALNPRKYLFGLARAAQDAGAVLFQTSEVLGSVADGALNRLSLKSGELRAEKVLVCTNGYSSEDLPIGMAARYMPVQSSVMVTRPLTDAELDAQGWYSEQMAYDTRNLLHYFRLMPDKRFLFGMRGGLLSSDRAEAANRKSMRASFDKMFPAWSDVSITHQWSGMVCMTRMGVPSVSEFPDHPGWFAAFGYHGNGVAMGSYCGHLLAEIVLGVRSNLPAPDFMKTPPSRFPLGRFRRLLMPPVYAALGVADL